MKNTIMICLEKLDIGGVETFVINQVNALIKSYNIIVLARKGIYCETITKLGVKFIEFDFKDSDFYELDKIDEISDIIKKYNVTEVRVNQFSPINYIFIPCIINNIPYIPYLHLAPSLIEDKEKDPYLYLEQNYALFKERITLFYKYAYKIVGITTDLIDYISKRYDIPKDKFVLERNSIDFSKFKTTTKVKNIKNILIISRLSEEKKLSIINGIDLFLKLQAKSNVHLTIAGDGLIRNEIEEYVKQRLNKNNYTFLGGITNVQEVMDKSDVVIGIDRCIIEAIALKKIAIISNYTGAMCIVNKNNIKKHLNYNFSGKDITNTDLNTIANKISSFKNSNITHQTEENHKIAKEILDIYKNIHVYDIKNYKYTIDINDFMLKFAKMMNNIGKKVEDTQQVANELWKNKFLLEDKINELYAKYDEKLLRKIYIKFKNVISKILKKFRK